MNVYYRTAGDSTFVMLGYLYGLSRRKPGDSYNRTRGIIVALLNAKPSSHLNKTEKKAMLEITMRNGQGKYFEIGDQEVADLLHARWRFTCAEKSPNRGVSLGVVASEIASELEPLWEGIVRGETQSISEA